VVGVATQHPLPIDYSRALIDPAHIKRLKKEGLGPAACP
jgi:hypothetical protein